MWIDIELVKLRLLENSVVSQYCIMYCRAREMESRGLINGYTHVFKILSQVYTKCDLWCSDFEFGCWLIVQKYNYRFLSRVYINLPFSRCNSIMRSLWVNLSHIEKLRQGFTYLLPNNCLMGLNSITIGEKINLITFVSCILPSWVFHFHCR